MPRSLAKKCLDFTLNSFACRLIHSFQQSDRRDSTRNWRSSIFWNNLAQGYCLYGTLPPELWKLTNLIEINVEGNALHGVISSELYDLSSLTKLNLASNSNEGDCNHTDGSVTTVLSTGFQGNILEPKISNLTKLRVISVFSNNFNGSIPSEIGSLLQLGVLYDEP